MYINDHVHMYIHVITYICIMNALIVQNSCHKCDWETRMTTDKKINADYN